MKRKENFALCLDISNGTGRNFPNILEWVFRNLKNFEDLLPTYLVQ